MEPNFKNPPKIILCKTFVKLPFDMNEVIEMTGNGNHVNLLNVARKNMLNIQVNLFLVGLRHLKPLCGGVLCRQK